MKVQFEFSASDLAEVASRASDRSRVVQGWRWQGRIIYRPMGTLLVRDRAFLTPEDREQFLALAHRLIPQGDTA